MNLNIVTPHAVDVYEVVWLEICTPVGSMVIQKDHAPMIIELVPGQEISFQLLSGKQQSIAVVRGFVHVTRDNIKIIVN
ncbi:hypothetical protein EBQ93_01080 [bacterium]|jgi:F0F1-type ATP synthase epsilon subunit|nr:hypothetical protein [bacterium]